VYVLLASLMQVLGAPNYRMSILYLPLIDK
jgi:hypothetical protein